MTAAARRPRTGLRPAAVLSCAGVLGLLLSGCGQSEPEPEPEVSEMAEPPNREIETPELVAGAEMPVWGHSAACDEPRPLPDEDGLRIPAPVPDEERIVFFVPSVELTLCGLPGVVSASLDGSYTADGAREGEADLGLVFAPGASAEQIEAAWSTGIAEAQAQLDGTGISLADTAMMLAHGSMITGPAEPSPREGTAESASSIPQAIDLHTELRAASPVPEDEAGESGPASASPSAEAADEPPPVPRWSIEAGQGLAVTTVYSSDLSAEGARSELAGVLAETQEVTTQDPGATRSDAVSVIDGRMQLTVEAPQLELLTEDLAQDLHALGQIPDLQATARLEAGDDGRPVLEVRSQSLPEYAQPQYEETAEALELSAAEAGVILDHRLDGERLPLDEQ